jgi:cell shape-determining protein MreC
MNPHAMTPDQLLAWSKKTHTGSMREVVAGIIHLHGEYSRLKDRCKELLARWTEYEQLKEDLAISRGHVDAYQKENQRLRGLLDAKTKAPWEGK